MGVRLRDTLTPGSACVSRVTPVRLGLSASRRNELFVTIVSTRQVARLPKTRQRLIAVSGEHRLPACKFRQLAETVARFNRSAGTRRYCRQAAGNCGLAARAPRSRSRKSATARTRSPTRETRAPPGLPAARLENSHSPTLLCKVAIAYSRFSLAMKLALISAGHTASHS